MTEKKGIKRLAGKVGGIKNLILIPLATLWLLTLLLDIFVVEKIFDPLGYLYLALGIVVLLYVVWPLYTSRRLVQYYWQRVKRNRLAVAGLSFYSVSNSPGSLWSPFHRRPDCGQL